MSRDTSNITLGSGRLYINDIEVGYLKGDVEFAYTREKLDFKPSGALAMVDRWIIGEAASLKASIAEFKAANLKLAMGGGGGEINSFTGNPSYNPASFSGSASKTYDYLTFGGGTAVTTDLAIRFEHIRPKSGKLVVIILYKAVSSSDLALAFHDEDFNLTDVVFEGVMDTTRPAGDQMGMVVEQITA